jgi:hypothetical protein
MPAPGHEPPLVISGYPVAQSWPMNAVNESTAVLQRIAQSG